MGILGGWNPLIRIGRLSVSVLAEYEGTGNGNAHTGELTRCSQLAPSGDADSMYDRSHPSRWVLPGESIKRFSMVKKQGLAVATSMGLRVAQRVLEKLNEQETNNPAKRFGREMV